MWCLVVFIVYRTAYLYGGEFICVPEVLVDVSLIYSFPHKMCLHVKEGGGFDCFGYPSSGQQGYPDQWPQ